MFSADPPCGVTRIVQNPAARVVAADVVCARRTSKVAVPFVVTRNLSVPNCFTIYPVTADVPL